MRQGTRLGIEAQTLGESGPFAQKGFSVGEDALEGFERHFKRDYEERREDCRPAGPICRVHSKGAYAQA